MTEIASALGRNKHSTGRYLDILHAAGHIDLKTFGMAKVFTLSSKVPLSALLSYTTDLVFVLDREMRVVQANDPFFDLIQMESGSVLKKRIDQITTPHIATDHFLAEIATIVTNKQESFEILLNRDNKSYFRGKIIPTVFEDGSSADTIILEDITREKEALKNLQESETFFRAISEHLSDGLIVSEIRSGEKKVIFFNQRLCEITGYSADEIHALRPENLAIPEEKQRFEKALREAECNKGAMKELRFWAKRKDGVPIYLSIRVKLVPFGDAMRVYILITDMTRWKEQEEAQLLQATLIQRLITNFPHPIFIIRDDGVFFTANPAFCELLRSDPESIIDHHATEVMPADIAREFLQGNDELIHTHTHSHIHTSTRFFRPDGAIGVVTIEKSPVSAGENAPTYIFGVVITENTCPTHKI